MIAWKCGESSDRAKSGDDHATSSPRLLYIGSVNMTAPPDTTYRTQVTAASAEAAPVP